MARYTDLPIHCVDRSSVAQLRDEFAQGLQEERDRIEAMNVWEFEATHAYPFTAWKRRELAEIDERLVEFDRRLAEFDLDE